MTEQEQRAAVIAEAVTWLRTPFRDQSCCKGAGVDCCYLIKAAYENSGVHPNLDIGFYSPQIMLHTDRETYIEGILANGGHEITEAEVKPADIVLYRVGRIFGHGAIVVDWPTRIIHATRLLNGVGYSDTTRDKWLSLRERRFFSFWQLDLRWIPLAQSHLGV